MKSEKQTRLKTYTVEFTGGITTRAGFKISTGSLSMTFEAPNRDTAILRAQQHFATAGLPYGALISCVETPTPKNDVA